ncbi:IS481 family transposase domain protein [Rickettsiales endosymbiont of Paramecium tredecaurelia]|nr:IS481 family transposase domain protein [Candidatus Sarmatiella mevalonica]
MGQILHTNARTTEAIRRESRDGKESIKKAAKRFNRPLA